MKYAEFNISGSKIEFWNSMFGIESVFVDGKQISKRFSFSGIIHNIKLNSQNLTLESKYEQFNKREIELKLKKNGELVEKIIVKVDKKQRIYWMIIEIIIGISAYKTLNFLIGYSN